MPSTCQAFLTRCGLTKSGLLITANIYNCYKKANLIKNFFLKRKFLNIASIYSVIMNNAVKLLFGLVLLLSMVNASSINIDSMSSVPAQTLWTTSISYDLSNNHEAKIYLDNELLITVFEHNGKAFVDDSLKSNKVLNYTTTSSELTLSIAGMQEGSYNLEAKLYLGEEKLDAATLEIQFYNWQDKIDSLESTNQAQSNLIKTLQTDLNAKTLEIEKLKINNQLTSETIRQINSNITTLQESDIDKNTSLTQINSDLNKLLVDKSLETSLTGFFGMASSPFSIVAMFGMILLIVVGAILYQREKKKDTLY